MKSFNEMVNQALTGNMQHMRPVIEKELLHYDILYSLTEANLLDTLTFQGGTSLRLCYGAPRFSEDLDFTGGHDFDYKQLATLKECVMDYLSHKYGLEVNITTPNPNKVDSFNDGINILKWQISITTAPERKDIPRQRIKLEVANIDSLTMEQKGLKKNYPFLPDGYMDTLIPVQSLDEIMADKIVAFVNSQRYVRHRDIWDLLWLTQQGAQLDIEMIEQKIDAYQADNYLENLENRETELLNIITGKPFQEEMRRFIPLDVQERTLNRKGFSQFLSASVGELLTQTKNYLYNDDSEPEYESFRI